MTVCFIVASQYGFTTGLAEQIQERLYADSNRDFEVINAAFLKKQRFYSECADFVYMTSTFYQGGNPEAGQRFLDYIFNDGAAKYELKHKRFAVLGVGDSQFEHYQNAAHSAEQFFTQRYAYEIASAFEFDREGSKVDQLQQMWIWLGQVLEAFSA